MSSPDSDDLETQLLRAISGAVPPTEVSPGSQGEAPEFVQQVRALAESKLPADLPRGTALGPFEILGFLSKGGMGAVYRARHTRTGAQVALKVVYSGSSEDPTLKNEADCLAKIQLANVVKLVDRGEDEQYVWSATTLVEGPTLADVCKERLKIGQVEEEFIDFEQETETRRGTTLRETLAKVLPKAEAAPTMEEIKRWVRWWRDLARTIHALSLTGMVHRDIKPQNIIIADNQVPVLIDFGLSFTDDSDLASNFSGTVPYLAPEQTLHGNLGLDSRGDIYSLAISFYELIAGERVVQRAGKSPQQVLQEIASKPVPPISTRAKGIPPTLDAIFERCLRKVATERYADGEELAVDLDAWLEDERPRNVRETRHVVLWRRRRPIAAISALAVLIIASLVFFSVKSANDKAERVQNAMQTAHAQKDEGATKEALATLAAVEDDIEGHAEAEKLRAELVARRADDMHSELLASTELVFVDSNRIEFMKLLAAEAESLARFLPDNPRLLLVRLYVAFLSEDNNRFSNLMEDHRSQVERHLSLVELGMLYSVRAGDTAKVNELREIAAESPLSFDPLTHALRGKRLLIRRPDDLKTQSGRRWKEVAKSLIEKMAPHVITKAGSRRPPRLLVAVSLRLRLARGELDDQEEVELIEEGAQFLTDSATVDGVACRIFRLELALLRLDREIRGRDPVSPQAVRELVDQSPHWKDAESLIAAMTFDNETFDSGRTLIDFISKTVVRAWNRTIAMRWWQKLREMKGRGMDFVPGYYTVNSAILAMEEISNSSLDVELNEWGEILDAAGLQETPRAELEKFEGTARERQQAAWSEAFIHGLNQNRIAALVREATRSAKAGDSTKAAEGWKKARELVANQGRRRGGVEGSLAAYDLMIKAVSARSKTGAEVEALRELISQGSMRHEVSKSGDWAGWREIDYSMLDDIAKSVLEVCEAKADDVKKP